MLLVHPTSTCDVCMENYNWTTPENVPWVISCGHVYCLSCLRSLRSRLCPMCRKPFVFKNIKKLHADQLDDKKKKRNLQDAAISVEFNFLNRIALVSGVDMSEEEVNEVVSHVRLWLAKQPPSSHHLLRFAVKALEQGKDLRKQILEDKKVISQLKSAVQHCHRAADYNRKDAQATEASLTTRLREAETKLSRFAARSKVIDFFERIALLSRVNAPEADIKRVVSDVKVWLVTQPPRSHNPLRRAIIALEQSKTLEKQAVIDKDDIERLKSKVQRYCHKADLLLEESVAQKVTLQAVENDLSIQKSKVQALQSEASQLRRESIHRSRAQLYQQDYTQDKATEVPSQSRDPKVTTVSPPFQISQTPNFPPSATCTCGICNRWETAGTSQNVSCLAAPSTKSFTTPTSPGHHGLGTRTGAITWAVIGPRRESKSEFDNEA